MSTVEETRLDTSFYWGWQDGMTETTISECGTYAVSVVGQSSNSTSVGVPPYYMVAWKVNGVPTTSYIGMDRANLTWKVNQESGSSIVLTVIDSRGMMGGVDPNIYTVVDGNSTTNCLPPTPEKISLTANVSTSTFLETCEPLDLRVDGGQKPYTVSIAVLNSVTMTNITLNDDDDVLTWPNKAEPGKQLLVSVFDANGVWGISTGIYNTDGANSTDCAILTTSRKSGSADEQPSGSASNNQNDSGFGSNALHYVAIIVPIVIVGLLIGLVFFFLRRRRRKGYEPQPAIVPEAWLGPSSLIDRQPGTGGKAYQQLSRSEDILLEPKRVVQHQDAADIEFPPPYRDRITQTIAPIG